MTASSNPLSSKFDLIQQQFATLSLDHAVSTISLQELSLSIQTSDLINVMTFLYDAPELAFKQLVDICAVDYIDRPQRFDVVYHLLSHHTNVRVRIKIAVNEQDVVPTAVYLYSAANWYEREAFDLYGITFKGHPDLRRLLTDYNFQGHPMRKDFPLTGYVEPAYDPVQKKVVYNPVILPQEYRDFDFSSPWQGMTPASPMTLPGDEKAQLNP